MPVHKRKRSSVAKKSASKSRRPSAKGRRALALVAVSRRKGRKIAGRRGSSGLIKRAVSAMSR
jgi:hypothetical protein